MAHNNYGMQGQGMQGMSMQPGMQQGMQPQPGMQQGMPPQPGMPQSMAPQQQHSMQQPQQQQQRQQQRPAAEPLAATSQPSRPAVGASPFDYVKNKIAEVMRTSDKAGDESEEPAKRARLEPAALCLTRGSNGGVATPPPAAGRGTPTDGPAL